MMHDIIMMYHSQEQNINQTHFVSVKKIDRLLVKIPISH